MFNLLTISYLFLGGAGAGALVVLSLLEFVNARRRFGLVGRDGGMARTLQCSGVGSWHARAGAGGSSGRRLSGPKRMARRFVLPDEFFARAWPLCFVVLALGVLCLLFDVGRPDRLLHLVVSPTASPISVGAYTLVASLMLAAVFSALSLFDGRCPSAGAVRLLGSLGAVVGVVAASYTGVLLSGLASVLFWQTPLLPALFALSSLSCGVACVFLAAAFVEVRQVITHPLRALARVDSALIVLEAACLVGFVVRGLAGEGTHEAAFSLVAGEFRWLFWGGLAVLGLAVPLVMEQYVAHGNYSTQLVFVAALVLLGGFVLRWCVAGAAAYDVTQMPATIYGLVG